MPTPRRHERTSAGPGHTGGDVTAADGHEQAAEAIRSLRNKIVHFSVSDPADTNRTIYAEFEIPMSEPIIAIFSIILANEKERYAKLIELRDQLSGKPSAKVVAALKDLEQAGSWFKTKEELFHALEAPGEEQG